MYRSRSFATLGLILILALAAFAYQRGTAHAETIFVTPNSADVIANNGSCSFREAVINANNNDQSGSTDCAAGDGTDDIIVLPPGTYLYAIAGNGEENSLTGDIDILESLDIEGSGANNTIIDANGFDNVIDIQADGVTLNIGNVMLRNAIQHGLRNNGDGTVNISDAIVEEINTDVNGGAGVLNQFGGVVNADNVLIRDVTTTANRGSGFNNNGSGTMNVTNSVVRDSSFHDQGGGGYNNSSGTFNLSDSLITENTSSGTFGNATAGVGNNSNGAFNVIDTTISNNSVETSGCNTAGGVYNNSSGTMTIIRSTISNNENASTGCNNAGGLNNNSSGTMTVVNSTVSGNSTTSVDQRTGGGFYNNSDGTVNVTNSTFINNSGGTANSFLVNGSADVNLKNTIIATDAAGDNCDALSTGAVVSLGNNLADDDTCNLTAGGDLPNTDPEVGPLQDNGGPTFTHALLEGSDAIDSGDNAACAAAPVNNVDQRGVERPQDGDDDGSADCDIGAYEAQAARIKVVKKLSDRSRDTFDLQINGVTYADNVGSGGSTGWIGVTPGLHTVGETASDGGAVRGYSASISCYDGYKLVAYERSSSLKLYVKAGAAVVCTITNSPEQRGRGR